MEPHTQTLLDQVGHPFGRPQVGPEPVLRRRVSQPPEDLLLLGGVQERLAARVRLGRQGGVPASPVCPDPLPDRLRVDAPEGGDILPGPALAHALDGQPPTGFQFRSTSFASHPEQVTIQSLDGQVSIPADQ